MRNHIRLLIGNHIKIIIFIKNLLESLLEFEVENLIRNPIRMPIGNKLETLQKILEIPSESILKNVLE